MSSNTHGDLTEMEIATAQQIALCCGRDKPEEQDIETSKELVKAWNHKRKILGLAEWV